jgi:Ca2+-binding RTX toxin-like protein
MRPRLVALIVGICAASMVGVGIAGAQAPGDPCAAVAPGADCRPGNGVRSAGGEGKVSHKGWPAFTGVIWKVDSGDHRLTGGPLSDELLGHHGDDVIAGGDGADVLWGDWDPEGNTTRQADVLDGEGGDDFLYSSHGRNTIDAGPGDDLVWAYYGRGTIDCGAGSDTLRVRLVNDYETRNCERVRNFCAFGSKPGGGCYKPGERPRRG